MKYPETHCLTEQRPATRQRRHVLYGEGSVFDAIGIATDHCAKVGVIRFGIIPIGRATVVAKDNILRIPFLVWDEKAGESGAIRYEGRVNARRSDCVFSEDGCITRALSQCSETERRPSEKRGNHDDQPFTVLRKRLKMEEGIYSLKTRDQGKSERDLPFSLYVQNGPSSTPDRHA